MSLRTFSLSITAAVLAAGLLAAVAPASAQTSRIGDPYCGSWMNGTWTPNGNCNGYMPTMRAGSVNGTITSVTGHLVTIQQALGTIVINDTPALRRQTSGPVAVGRQIAATGYWRAGTFYATNIAGAVAAARMSRAGDPYCGSWMSGTWTPNGNCAGYMPTMRAGAVSGTITFVTGHLVTVQQTTQTIVINDAPALRRQTSGRVAVGRQITATGYWRGGTFYATNIN